MDISKRTPDQLESAIRWVRNHARRIKCPKCSNQKRPNIISTSLVRGVCICPECKQIWIYKCDISQKQSQWKPVWYPSKDQLNNVFLYENL